MDKNFNLTNDDEKNKIIYMLDIFDELKNIIKSLNNNNLEYALCGGLAMAIHSFPRATIDIDMIVMSEDQIRIKELLAGLGYTMESAPMSFHKDEIKINRISKTDPDSEDILSVDILTVTEKLQSVWNNRTDYEWDNGIISVVSKEGLIYMKKLRGSGQDKDDIKKLCE